MRPVLVVKIGGVEGLDYAAVCEDLASLVAGGRPVVVVHGGSAEASALAPLGSLPPPATSTMPSGSSVAIWPHESHPQ